MSFEGFQLIDNETNDISVIKKDFMKIYHQQGALLIDFDQNIDFVFGENFNYSQISNAYLQYDKTVKKRSSNSW